MDEKSDSGVNTTTDAEAASHCIVDNAGMPKQTAAPATSHNGGHYTTCEPDHHAASHHTTGYNGGFENITNIGTPLLDHSGSEKRWDGSRTPSKTTLASKDHIKHETHLLTRRDIIRNLVILAVTWFFVLTAYSTLEILQSSLNANLGVLNITLLYIFKVFSSLRGPNIIVKLTPKWTMVLGYACHTVFLLANFHATWYTLLPAGVLLGMAMGPIWICFGVYVTVLSVKYSEITGSNKAAVLSKFNGIMAMALPCSFILGLLLSSFIFKYVRFDEDHTSGAALGSEYTPPYPEIAFQNATVIENTGDSLLSLDGTASAESLTTARCGLHYCPADGYTNTEDDTRLRPQTKVVRLLITVLGVFNITGLFLAVLCLENLPQDDIKSGIKVASKICSQIWIYLKTFFNWQFMILSPAITYIFSFITLMNSMLPKAYITCSVGIEMVGYVSMTRGLTGMAMNFLSGWLGQYIHRNYHFAVAMLLVVTATASWFLWDYWQQEITVLFVTATVGGCANAINLSQFSAFLGYAFTNRKTEAFAFFHFWSGIMTAAAFFSNNYICTKHQLYSLYVVMVITIVTFCYLSYHLQHYRKQEVTMEIEVNDQSQDKGTIKKSNRQLNLTDVDATFSASQPSLA